MSVRILWPVFFFLLWLLCTDVWGNVGQSYTINVYIQKVLRYFLFMVMQIVHAHLEYNSNHTLALLWLPMLMMQLQWRSTCIRWTVIVKFICDRYAYVTGVYKILDSLRIFSRGKFLSKIYISYFDISYFRRSGFFDLFIIYDMLLCQSVHTHFLVNWCCWTPRRDHDIQVTKVLLLPVKLFNL